MLSVLLFFRLDRMKRRQFIKQSAGTVVVAGIASAIPVAAQAASAQINAPVTHYVLFWLKPQLTQQQVKDFTGFFEELKKVRLVKSLRYGRAANTVKRDVVDNSFSYAMVAGFNSITDQDRYQDDPLHLAAVKKYSGFWEKVVVHDAIMI